MKTRQKTIKAQHHILILIVCILLSCVNKTDAQESSGIPIIGNWVLNYQASLGSISGNAKIHYDSMNPIKKQYVQNYYKGRRFSFYENGNYEMLSGNGTIQQGSWSLSNNGSKLYLISADGKTMQCTISFSGTNMVLKIEGKAKALLKLWYLTATS